MFKVLKRLNITDKDTDFKIAMEYSFNSVDTSGEMFDD